MSNQTKKSNNYIKLQQEHTLPKFTKSLSNVLGTNVINKKSGKIIYQMNVLDYDYNDDNYTNKNECLICYEKVENKSSKVTCNLCSNIFHYKCYKAFIKKNSNYTNKCCHCATPSLKFTMKYWWNYCCW